MLDIIETKNLTFSYPETEEPALKDLTVSVPKGSFVLLCGPSGCGKTTFLKLLKPELSPHGERTGSALYEGEEVRNLDLRTSASRIGFVMQDPEAQIVTDEVWHELAFGLENLGVDQAELRQRVGEMANYFGIASWYHKKTVSLSGGQKQMLNLASVMVMGPEILLLDEPTAQLDPIAAEQFISTLQKLNRDLGVTIILSEHRLEEIFPIADRVLVLDGGRCAAFDKPGEVCRKLSSSRLFSCFPTAARVYAGLNGRDSEVPVSVRDGRKWLEKNIQSGYLKLKHGKAAKLCEKETEPALTLHNVWFRYDRMLPDVLSDMNVTFDKGALTAILGGNGVGKTTALLVMAGLLKPYRGHIKWMGKPISSYRSGDRHQGFVSMLPQNPGLVFVKDRVIDDWKEMIHGLHAEEIRLLCSQTAASFGISEKLLTRNPADLSGGELQKCALAKIMLGAPSILLLDEPTKGLDALSKEQLSAFLREKTKEGLTIVMVTHDVEFAAETADRCMLAFDGNLLSSGTPKTFFSKNRFYTTAASRMSKGFMDDAVTVSDICRNLESAGNDHDA